MKILKIYRYLGNNKLKNIPKAEMSQNSSLKEL